jgi:hypothetical protein
MAIATRLSEGQFLCAAEISNTTRRNSDIVHDDDDDDDDVVGTQ